MNFLSSAVAELITVIPLYMCVVATVLLDNCQTHLYVYMYIYTNVNYAVNR